MVTLMKVCHFLSMTTATIFKREFLLNIDRIGSKQPGQGEISFKRLLDHIYATHEYKLYNNPSSFILIYSDKEQTETEYLMRRSINKNS